MTPGLESQPLFSPQTINTIVAMVNREDIAYFGAGPASLPTDVLETAAASLQNFEETGL